MYRFRSWRAEREETERAVPEPGCEHDCFDRDDGRAWYTTIEARLDAPEERSQGYSGGAPNPYPCLCQAYPVCLVCPVYPACLACQIHPADLDPAHRPVATQVSPSEQYLVKIEAAGAARWSMPASGH